MSTHGKLIYREKRKIFDSIFRSLLPIFFIICLIVFIGFIILEFKYYNFAKYGVPRFVLFISLWVSIVLLTSYSLYHSTNFSFNIYELGFTYRDRLKGAERPDNFIAFDDIIGLKFIEYGCSLLLKMKNGNELRIDVPRNHQSYTTLAKILINRFHLFKYPNLEAITRFIDSNDQEVIKYVNGRIINIENEAFKEMVDLNKDFV